MIDPFVFTICNHNGKSVDWIDRDSKDDEISHDDEGIIDGIDYEDVDCINYDGKDADQS